VEYRIRKTERANALGDFVLANWLRKQDLTITDTVRSAIGNGRRHLGIKVDWHSVEKRSHLDELNIDEVVRPF
jgi:hypothetical protein